MTCLTDDELDRFAADDWASADLNAASSHISSCPECARRFAKRQEEMAGLAQELRAAVVHSDPAGDSTVPSGKRPLAVPAPPAPPVLPDYDLIKFLGKGGFGQVWLGRQRVTGMYCAVKIVPQGEVGEIEIEGIREYKLRASGNPHLVQIEHVGVVGDLYYYVMELADDARGEGVRSPEGYEPLTLSEEIKRRGRLPPSECAAIGMQLLAGLDHLHACGLLHRDVKPANVLRRAGRWILGDIGLATVHSKSGAIAGTPPYLPPEGVQDRRGDVYALGILLMALVSGTTPARDTTPADLVSSLPTTPGTLGAVISVACQAQGAKRYQSALEMSQALQAVVALPASRSNKTRRRSVALSFLLAVVIIGCWWTARDKFVPSRRLVRPHVEIQFKRSPTDTGYDIVGETNVPLPTGSLIQVHASLAQAGYPYLLGVSQTDPPVLLDAREDWPVAPIRDFFSPPLAPAGGSQRWHRLDPPAGPVMLLLVVSDAPVRDPAQLTSKIQGLRCPDLDRLAMLEGDPEAPVFHWNRQRGISPGAASAPKGILRGTPMEWRAQFSWVEILAFSHELRGISSSAGVP